MKKVFSYKSTYDGFMDKECIEICNILNSLPSVKTSGSCSGHGRNSFSVFFNCTDWRSLSFIGRCIDCRYWKYGKNWEVMLSNSDINQTYTVIQLKSVDIKGEESYKQIRSLCKNMVCHLNHENYMDYFMKDKTGFLISEIN